MERGDNLAALRRLARQEILAGLPAAEPTASWVRQSPAVVDLLAAATELRLSQPHTAAISLLTRAGQAYPEAFDFLNRGGLILDAAMLVKFVNRYDRPALALRLWRRGWLDVYGAPEPWSPYGITPQPTVPFPRLASVYRRYPAHLNAANCARDATANEKLFEIAACARVSLNLDSPEVRACYSGEEIFLADTEEALEAAAEKVLRDPAAALAAGEKGAPAHRGRASLGTPVEEGARMKSASIPSGVLILSNDLLTPFAKTSDYLAAALERRGIPAYVRDNAEARLLTYLFSAGNGAERCPGRRKPSAKVCASSSHAPGSTPSSAST